ncbi:hypothetical protein WJ39_22855 [Burkholderia diffusa]|nr:hypothetical protein WJ39_22855 [Burkholderia diffusa]
MAATERITMTMRELDRFKVIQDVADGKLKPWRAAERLGLTTRQIERLVIRYRESGAPGTFRERFGMSGPHCAQRKQRAPAHIFVHVVHQTQQQCFGLGTMRTPPTESRGQLPFRVRLGRIDRGARECQQRVGLRPEHVRYVFQRVVPGNRVRSAG